MRYSRLQRLTDTITSWMAFVLCVVLAWWILLGSALITYPQLALLLPFVWLSYLPFWSVIRELLDPHTSTAWWVWAELLLTVSIWLFLFRWLRGMYYTFLGMNKLWIMALLLMIALMLLFFIFMMNPVYDQLGDVWHVPEVLRVIE